MDSVRGSHWQMPKVADGPQTGSYNKAGSGISIWGAGSIYDNAMPTDQLPALSLAQPE